MSAEVLRRAASLMRERAEAAERVHSSPWKPMGAGSVAYPMLERISGTVAETFPKGGSAQQADTTDHIASWHPAVALAVADWLDFEANCTDRAAKQFPSDQWDADERALAVARAYLGEQPC